MRSDTTFNPQNFNFVFEKEFEENQIWKTFPVDGYLIGSYRIIRDTYLERWEIYETVLVNNIEKDIKIYCGWIPDDRFGFELLCNLDLLLPVIQREIKINSLI